MLCWIFVLEKTPLVESVSCGDQIRHVLNILQTFNITVWQYSIIIKIASLLVITQYYFAVIKSCEIILFDVDNIFNNTYIIMMMIDSMRL